MIRLGILGGGLQGVEAAFLARLAGWETVLADSRPAPPASGLADIFIQRQIKAPGDAEEAFKSCDLILPACENKGALDVLLRHSRRSGQVLAFDPAAWRISSDKRLSRDFFIRSGIPIPRPYPEAAWPLIAKPAKGSGSRGVRLLSGPADFQSLFPAGDTGGWIVEEYCPGPSFSLEITGRPGRHRAFLTTALEMDEIYDCRQVRAPAGLPAELEAEFRAISLKLADGLNLSGLMDVEIIAAPQGLRVLEIDARFPSQTPLAVYWASGENLLRHMLSNFISLPAPPPPPPGRAVILEHVDCGGENSSPKFAGEHIMARSGPLHLEENFFGADWALTDRRNGHKNWAATLIILGADEKAARERQKDVRAGLKYMEH